MLGAGGLVLAVLLGGCGKPVVPPTPKVKVNAAGPAGRGPSATTPLSSLTSVQSPLSRPRLARKEAARLLDAALLPPGSRPSAAEPAGDGHVLKAPPQSIGSPNLVDLHRFFVAPSAAVSVQAWLRSHPSGGATAHGYGSQDGPKGVQAYFVVDTFAEVRNLFDNPVLDVSDAPLPGRRSAIRVDAQVTWLPAKPPGDVVGPAGELTVSVSEPLGARPGRYREVSTTDRAKIAAIRRSLNELQVYPPGQFGCPADVGGSLELSFRVRSGRPPFARVVAATSGCQQVEVYRGAHPVWPELWGIGLNGHADFATTVERLMGLPAGYGL